MMARTILNTKRVDVDRPACPRLQRKELTWKLASSAQVELAALSGGDSPSKVTILCLECGARRVRKFKR